MSLLDNYLTLNMLHHDCLQFQFALKLEWVGTNSGSHFVGFRTFLKNLALKDTFRNKRKFWIKLDCELEIWEI